MRVGSLFCFIPYENGGPVISRRRERSELNALR